MRPDDDDRWLTRLLRHAEQERRDRVCLLVAGSLAPGEIVEVRQGLEAVASSTAVPPGSRHWTAETCTVVSVTLVDLRVYLGHRLLGIPHVTRAA